MPITGDAERSLPNARRKVAGRSEGQSQRMEAWPLLRRGNRAAEALSADYWQTRQTLENGVRRRVGIKEAPAKVERPGLPKGVIAHIAGTPLATCAVAPISRANSLITPYGLDLFGLGSRSWAEGNTREPSGAQS